MVFCSGLYPLYNNYYGVFIVLLCITISGWWFSTILKNICSSNGKDDIPYVMENKKCLKPPNQLLNGCKLVYKPISRIKIYIKYSNFPR